MRHFDFSPDTMAEIKRDRFRGPNPMVQERMEVLWLKAHGEKHARIAELACVSRATVQRVLDLYEDGGAASRANLSLDGSAQRFGPASV